MGTPDFPHRLSLERIPAYIPINIEGKERNEGCTAKLEDNGERQSVPVCMGGTAIVGCNNYDECHEPYGERINDPHRVHVLFRDDENRVSSITTVPRAPLVPPES
jgi:hypothetical protein